MENFENDESKKERQLDNLVNIVENHTRTERHLEQYSHIGDPDNKDTVTFFPLDLLHRKWYHIYVENSNFERNNRC